MKIIRTLLPLLLLLVLPSGVLAQLTWTTNKGTITITRYNDEGFGARRVKIPVTITGLPVTSIGPFAFTTCMKVASVTIPNSVSNIGVGAFWSCPLWSITVDAQNSAYASVDGVLFDKSKKTLIKWPELMEGSFMSGSYTVPDGVTSISSFAFARCANLKSITIPSSVTNIGWDVFQNCIHLNSISVNPQNPAYTSADGVLFDKGQTELIQCPGGKTGSYTIPKGVTRIDKSAFSSCVNLKVVTIPNSVSNIANAVFMNCSDLTTIRIPDGVTSIESSAFGDCRSLESLTIPNSVTNIGSQVFFYCRSLKSITIPDSVANIGVQAFYGCTSLKKVYFNGNAPTLDPPPQGITTHGDPRIFADDNHVTVYYRAGTKGWGTTFGDRPAVLWKP